MDVKPEAGAVSGSKETARALWSMGDYGEVARRMQPAADALVSGAGVGAGDRVVDVAAGTGNVAIAAARRGASVVAVDISPGLVARGKARSSAAKLAVEWKEGDAEELPFDDASFDAALSAFGVLYAPRPEVAAVELFRVVVRDGVVGVANWARGSFQDAVGRALLAFSPGGPLPEPAIDWGDAAQVQEVFVPHAATMDVRHRRVGWCFDSLDDWLDRAEQVAPPLVALRKVLDDGHFDELRWVVREAAEPFVTRTRHGVLLDQRYVIVVARKR